MDVDRAKIGSDGEFVERYLKGLWDSRTAKYFTQPNFHSEDLCLARGLKPEDAEQLYIGGYPNGMLRGLRVKFRPKLTPWLKCPRRLMAPSNMWASTCRRSSCVFTTRGCSTSVQNRSSEVQKILDALLWHAGGRSGAKFIWDLLRRHSNQIIVRMEDEMDKDLRQTFAVYARECVLNGREEPPLCRFMCENPTKSLVETLKNLKAPTLRSKVRKLRSSMEQNGKTQRFLGVDKYYPDVNDLFTSEERVMVMDKCQNLKTSPREEPPAVTCAPRHRVPSTFPSKSSLCQLGPNEVPSRLVKRCIGAVSGQSSAKKPEHRLSQSVGLLELAIQKPAEPLCWTQLYDQHKLNIDLAVPNTYFSTKTKCVGSVSPSPRGGTLLLTRERVWKPREAIAT